MSNVLLVYDGSPAIFAGITTFKDGKLVSSKTHGTIGTHAPMKVFEIRYTKQK